MPVRQWKEVQEVLRRYRLVLPIAIVGFWLVMTALLLQRTVLVPKAAPGSADGVMRPVDSWMGIYGPSGNRLGFVNTTGKKEVRHGALGYASSITSKVSVNLLKKPTEIVIAGDYWAAEGGDFSELNLRVRSMGHTMRVAGTLENGVANLNIETAGEQFPISFPVGRNVVMVADGTGAANLNLPALQVGEEVMVDSFDPLTLSRGRAVVKCIGEETIVIGEEEIETKVLTTKMSGFESKAWVTADEEVVQAETALGLTLRKIAREEALKPVNEGNAQDLIRMMSVQPKGEKPFRGAERMVIRLSGVENAKPPVDDTQTLTAGGTYVITQSLAPGDPNDSTVLDPAGEFLTGDPLIQVDHPKIAAIAEEIVPFETDNWTKATRIYEWVFQEVDKVIVPSFPSALEVLDTRRGDCNEHTVLFTALARTLDVPTRIAIGIVWSDELNGFYYHAWPEVYAGRWIWLDPTLGQPIADATHIKLLSGDIDQWFQLVPYLGRLEVEVVDVQ